MSIDRPVPRGGVTRIAPYVPGKGGDSGGKVFKLSSNETPLGASPDAIAAFVAAGAHLELYPDGSSRALREAIGQRYGLDPARIVCGAGSDELLNLLAHAYLGPGDEAIFTEHGFLVYKIATLAAGGEPVVVPEKDLTADVDAILAAVSEKTRIVFIANPNNPTGTYLPIGEIKRLHEGLPRRVLLVLDAAYAEYVRRNDYESGIELVASYPNVVMTRTFSKIYGLASLRIGWAYCPEGVADALNRIRGPFNLSGPAIAAGAAAIADEAFVQSSAEHNSRWLEWLTRELEALGLKVTPSVGNFLLVHFPSDAGKTAADADAALVASGIYLRRLESYGLPGALRLSVGTEEANRAVVDTLTVFLGKA